MPASQGWANSEPVNVKSFIFFGLLMADAPAYGCWHGLCKKRTTPTAKKNKPRQWRPPGFALTEPEKGHPSLLARRAKPLKGEDMDIVTIFKNLETIGYYAIAAIVAPIIITALVRILIALTTNR